MFLPIVDMLTTMFNTTNLSDENLIGRIPTLFREYNNKVLELLKHGSLSTFYTAKFKDMMGGLRFRLR